MFSNIGIAVRPGVTAIEGAGIRVLTASEAVARCKVEDCIAPVMAIYVQGKWVPISSHDLKPHTRLWYGPLGAAKSVYVIGLGVNPEDHHIWDPLETCNAELFYVGPAPAGGMFLEWAEGHRKRRKAHHHFADSFEQAVAIISRKLKK